MTSAQLAKPAASSANGSAHSSGSASSSTQLTSPSKQSNGNASPRLNGHGKDTEDADAAVPEEIRELMQLVARYPEVYAQGASSVSSSGNASAAAAPEWLNKQDWLRQNALQAIKFLFEQGIASEQAATPFIHEFIEAIQPQLSIGADGTLKQRRATRSSAAAAATATATATTAGQKRKRGAAAAAAEEEEDIDNPAKIFAPTPISQLFLAKNFLASANGSATNGTRLSQEQRRSWDAQEAKQIWEQLELRHSSVAKLCDLVVTEMGEEGEEDEEEQDRRALMELDDEDDEDEDDDEELDEEELAELDTLSDAELKAIGIPNPKAFRKMRRAAHGDTVKITAGKDGEELGSEEEEDEDFDDDDLSSDDSEEDEDEDEEGFAGASDFSDEEEASRIVFEPLKTEEEQMEKKERLASSLLGIELDDDEDEDESEEEEEDEEEEEEEKGKKGNGAAAQSSRKGISGKRHPTLDDDFFSIDDFNKQTMADEINEQIQASGSSRQDPDDDIDLFQDLEAHAGGSDEEEEDAEDVTEMKYDDFFAPPKSGVRAAIVPSPPPKKVNGKGKGKEKELAQSTPTGQQAANDPGIDSPAGSARRIRFHDEVQIRNIKKAAQNRSSEDNAVLEMLRKQFAEGRADDSDEEDEEGEDSSQEDAAAEDSEDDDDDAADGESGEEDEDMEDPAQLESEDEDMIDEAEVESQASTEDPEAQTARRVARDLFADDEGEDEDSSNRLSTHERRQQALAAEIAQLEAENVGKKDWTLIGEASSRARPVDSLLAEDLEFEHTAKVKPIVTEEVNSSIEDLIKRRILDNNFDDVVKRVQLSATPFLPSKLLELSDSKSSKSLAELYEDEFQQAKENADGAPARVSEADAKLDKEHREIEGLFNDIFNKLDALSNAHFTPKAPKTTIQNLSNVAALSMESALPSTSNRASMLAPEEVFDTKAGGRESSSFAGAKGELTAAEKQTAYNRLRKQKRKRNERIDRTKREIEQARANAGVRPKLPKGRAGEREEKADAMKKLIGNKGVSVVGKDGKRSAKETNRGNIRDKKMTGDVTASSSKLKL